MPRSRLPVSRLKRRSTWPKLSRASQLARLIREIPAQLVPGRPKPPAGARAGRGFEFEAACDELEGLQILAESDGDLIVHLAEVRRAKTTTPWPPSAEQDLPRPVAVCTEFLPNSASRSRHPRRSREREKVRRGISRRRYMVEAGRTEQARRCAEEIGEDILAPLVRGYPVVPPDWPLDDRQRKNFRDVAAWLVASGGDSSRCKTAIWSVRFCCTETTTAAHRRKSFFTACSTGREFCGRKRRRRLNRRTKAKFWISSIAPSGGGRVSNEFPARGKTGVAHPWPEPPRKLFWKDSETCLRLQKRQIGDER